MKCERYKDDQVWELSMLVRLSGGQRPRRGATGRKTTVINRPASSSVVCAACCVQKLSASMCGSVILQVRVAVTKLELPSLPHSLAARTIRHIQLHSACRQLSSIVSFLLFVLLSTLLAGPSVNLGKSNFICPGHLLNSPFTSLTCLSLHLAARSSCSRGLSRALLTLELSGSSTRVPPSLFVMEVLLIVGAAALIGAYASSRNSRDRELARQAKKALSDAHKAHKRGDPQAAAYYLQVARDLSVQRLTEAEQRALNEAQQLKADGHPRRAEKKLARAREIRATLVRDFNAQSNQPSPSLPVAVPPSSMQAESGVAYPAVPQYAEYNSQLPSPPATSYHAFSAPSYLPPAPRYEESAAESAPPPGSVRYYNQPPLPASSNSQQPAYYMAAVPYQQPPIPSVAPPPYVPSISSSPSSQPWVAPTKGYITNK